MLTEKIYPNIDYSAHNLKKGDNEVYIDAYITTPSCPEVPKRSAVIIFPGGGYANLCPREAEPIALAFAARDFVPFVLWYTIKPGEFPCALLEAAWTVNFIRENAEKWHIDPNKIFTCGFSAGGHLSASIGTLWGAPEVREVLGYKGREARPDGVILCYPVISSGEYLEWGSFNNLLADRFNDEELRARVSLENAVTPDSSPAFIWHTADDPLVLVQHPLLFATALAKNSVPFELHILPSGPHGLGLARPSTGTQPQDLIYWVSDWPEHAAKWTETI